MTTIHTLDGVPPPAVAGRAMPPEFAECYTASFGTIAGQLADRLAPLGVGIGCSCVPLDKPVGPTGTPSSWGPTG